MLNKNNFIKSDNLLLLTIINKKRKLNNFPSILNSFTEDF